MRRELALQRLRCAECTTGSVVGTATWCVLNAQHASVIFTVLCELMLDPSQASSTRVAMLLVAHEVLIMCDAKGASAAGRATVATSSQVLIEAIKRMPPNFTEFWQELSKVVQWWRKLGLFPSRVLDDLDSATELVAHDTATDRPHSGEQSDDKLRSLAVPKELHTAATLIEQYNSSKAKFLQMKRDGVAGSELETQRDEAIRNLNSLISVLNEQSAHFTAFEMAEICSDTRQTWNVGHDEATSLVEDDILGSFF